MKLRIGLVLLTAWMLSPARVLATRASRPTVFDPADRGPCVDDLRGREIDFARLSRDYPNFTALPRLELGVAPLADRFRKVLALLPDAAVVAHVSHARAHPADLALRYWFSDQDPFLISDYDWVKMAERHGGDLGDARTAYEDFLADRPYLNGTVEPARVSLKINQQAVKNFARVLNAIEVRRGGHDAADLFRGWTIRPQFDASAFPIGDLNIPADAAAVPLPVGEYGTRLNQNLRRTVQALSLDELERITPPTADESVALGRIDRFHAIAQALNLVLIDRIGGGAPFDALVDELLTPDSSGVPPLRLVEDVVRPAVLRAATLHGYRFTRPLIRNAQHRLAPRPAFAAELTRIASATGYPATGLRADEALANLATFRAIYARVARQSSHVIR